MVQVTRDTAGCWPSEVRFGKAAIDPSTGGGSRRPTADGVPGLDRHANSGSGTAGDWRGGTRSPRPAPVGAPDDVASVCITDPVAARLSSFRITSGPVGVDMRQTQAVVEEARSEAERLITVAVCGSLGRRSSRQNSLSVISGTPTPTEHTARPRMTASGSRPEAKAMPPADKQAIPIAIPIAAYPPSTSRSFAGTLSPEPGTYGSGVCPATPAGTAFPAASLIPATTVSATTVSVTTGGCPTIGAPHPEHTRAVAATLAAHSRHLIWVMMADGLGRGGVLAGSL
jgi:hypothetical protein